MKHANAAVLQVSSWYLYNSNAFVEASHSCKTCLQSGMEHLHCESCVVDYHTSDIRKGCHQVHDSSGQRLELSCTISCCSASAKRSEYSISVHNVSGYTRSVIAICDLCVQQYGSVSQFLARKFGFVCSIPTMKARRADSKCSSHTTVNLI